jgi:hypothetical protein
VDARVETAGPADDGALDQRGEQAGIVPRPDGGAGRRACPQLLEDVGESLALLFRTGAGADHHGRYRRFVRRRQSRERNRHRARRQSLERPKRGFHTREDIGSGVPCAGREHARRFGGPGAVTRFFENRRDIPFRPPCLKGMAEGSETRCKPRAAQHSALECPGGAMRLRRRPAEAGERMLEEREENDGLGTGEGGLGNKPREHAVRRLREGPAG